MPRHSREGSLLCPVFPLDCMWPQRATPLWLLPLSLHCPQLSHFFLSQTLLPISIGETLCLVPITPAHPHLVPLPFLKWGHCSPWRQAPTASLPRFSWSALPWKQLIWGGMYMARPQELPWLCSLFLEWLILCSGYPGDGTRMQPCVSAHWTISLLSHPTLSQTCLNSLSVTPHRGRDRTPEFCHWQFKGST